MVKSRYEDFSVEELMDDQYFVQRIQNIETEAEWQRFMREHQLDQDDLDYLKELISLFKNDKEVLDSVRKAELWSRIQDNYLANKSKEEVIRLRNLLKVAASLIIMIGIGSILYLSLNKGNNEYFAELDQISDSGNAVLELASGERIEVQKAESTIKVLDQSKILVNEEKIYQDKNSITSNKKSHKMNTVSIPYGKKIMLELNDGTKVWLNAGSKFAFPQEFYGKERTVYLDGEGYFEVTKNKAMPFVVLSKQMKVEVLGTKFNFDSYSTNNVSETVLLEGKVNVSTVNGVINKKHTMLPNEKATIKMDDDVVLVEEEPAAIDRIAWIHGWYKFSNESVDNVLKKIARYYNVEIVYTEGVIRGALPVTGKLDLQDSFENVMLRVSKVSGVDYEIQNGKVLIK